MNLKVIGSNPFFRLFIDKKFYIMTFELCLFYLFSSFVVLSSIMVISLRNAVYSALFLIITFCNSVALFLLIGAEFLSFLFLIVYVGAIAVLFIFVIMMLNLKLSSYKISSWSTILVGFILFFNFIFQILISLNYNFNFLDKINFLPLWNNWIIQHNDVLSNIRVLGDVLYTKYAFIFVLSGFSLFISMISVIVLTMHQRTCFLEYKK